MVHGLIPGSKLNPSKFQGFGLHGLDCIKAHQCHVILMTWIVGVVNWVGMMGHHMSIQHGISGWTALSPTLSFVLGYKMEDGEELTVQGKNYYTSAERGRYK